MTSPDSFLNGNQVRRSQAWNAIIQFSPLKLNIEDSSDPTGDIKINIQSPWSLAFSSASNAEKFGSVPSTVNNASTENESMDAVFGLVQPNTPLSSSISDIMRHFAMTEENVPTEFEKFLTFIDQTGEIHILLDPSGNSRNALWMLSGSFYRSVVNLVFILPEIMIDRVKQFISDTYNLAIEPLPSSTRLSISMTTSYVPSASPLIWEHHYRIVLDVPINGFNLSLVFGHHGIDFRISNPSNVPRPQGSIFERLSRNIFGDGNSSNIDVGDLPNEARTSTFDQFLSNIDLWYISLARTMQPSDTPDADGVFVPIPGPLHWQINLVADWRSRAGIVVALRYDSLTSFFSGRLLFQTDASPVYAKRQHDYDMPTDISTATTRPLSAPIDLWKLLSLSGAPPQIPHLITDAGITFTKVPNGYSFGLSTTITSQSSVPSSDTNETPHAFNWDFISVAALVAQSGSDESLAVQISSEMSFLPKPGSSYPSATFLVHLGYETGGSWILRGSILDLKVGLLYSYFHSSVRESAIGILGNLELKYLEAVYTYHSVQVEGISVGQASSFFISGALVLGELQLDLSYEYASVALPPAGKPASQIVKDRQGDISGTPPLRPINGQDQWTFTAILSANSPDSTLRSVVNALTGKNLLPEFAASIPVKGTHEDNPSVKLILRGAGLYTALSVSLNLGDVSVTVVSLSRNLELVGTGESPKAKTIVRISLDEIPLVPAVPLVDVLPMPFDKLLYLWLDDDGFGLTKNELDVINEELAYLSIAKVEYMKITSDTALPVIRPGHHFMVADKGNVILDHCFSDAEANPPTQGPTGPQPPPGGTPEDETPPTKGHLDKKLPFLSISALSLLFKAGIIGFQFDSNVQLGLIDFTLLEFSLGVELSSIHLEVAHPLSKAKIVPDLHGLAVGLKAPPVTLAGVFIRDKRDGMESYRGGISLGFQAWKFLAIGEYAILDSGTFKTVFVYAKMMGPLMSIGFATVTGVRIGLGYNSAVRSPAIVELPKFPFLVDSVDSDRGDDPLAIVNSMRSVQPNGPPWVAPKQDAYWVAAGLTLTAFGILSVTAVLVLQMQPRGFSISVFANGIAQLPCNVNPNSTLFYVEIGMLSEINTVEGYFTVQAALAPTSHVLVPACRLTGGFALVNWFSPSPYAGDFVFTVGGYHRAYTSPAWYPKVERIGVSFTLGSMINVTGGVYFAVTPKCVMGGGALHFGLDVGPVSAWLDISLDVFIQFKPFHYMADLSVSVGCAISIKVWFVHIRIKASVGALLHIEGPDPFGGYANVDFYLFSFTIHFGGNVKPPPPATLLEFYDMVHNPGPESPPSESSEEPVDPMMSRLKFTLEEGLVPQPLPPRSESGTTSDPFPDSGPSKGWFVKSGHFTFTVICEFALSSAVLIGHTQQVPIRTSHNSEPAPLYSKPMHVFEPISSTLRITVYKLDLLNPDDPATRKYIDGFTATLIERPLPKALWGEYARDEDPAVKPNPSVLRNGSESTVTLAVGATVYRPENPENLIFSGIQEFDATIAMRAPLGEADLEVSAAYERSFLAGGEFGSNQSSNALRWKDFQQDWKDAADTSRDVVGKVAVDGIQEEGMLKMAAEWLGWNKPPPGTVVAEGTKMAWILNGKVPLGLLETLGVVYSVLPRECGVGA